MLLKSLLHSRPLCLHRSFSLFTKNIKPPVQPLTELSPPSQVESPIDLPVTSITEPLKDTISLKAYGLCNATPPGLVERLFETVHNFGDLSWGSTIVVSVVLIRVGLIPFMLSAQRNGVKMMEIKPELDEVKGKVAEARERGDNAAIPKLMQEVKGVYTRHGVNPLVSFLGLAAPMVQGCVFWSVNKMSGLEIQGWDVGGFGWFTDLGAVDLTWALPILASASLYGISRVSAYKGVMPPNIQSFMKYGAGFMLFVTLNFASVSLFLLVINEGSIAVYSNC